MKIHMLAEGQTAVRLNYRDLPDLDMLMLDIWRAADEEGGNCYSLPYGNEDEPTRFASQREPEWQWVKISPCHCGEHGWHWDSRNADRWPRPGIGEDMPERGEDPDLIADRPKGRFIALEWSR